MLADNKRVNSKYIISVESRKGGVGKTTAALCLGKILLKKGFEVLLLDTDITGTNIIKALNSAFWRDSTHIVTEAKGGKEQKQTNLLELFERGFMAGKRVPYFRGEHREENNGLVWEQQKINVIGSEIYSDDEGKLICKPSILFDELHAFWFTQCLKEICNGFQEAVGEDKRIAIVMDNSPGYVGIGPAIQTWLTDGGVDRNKFLFVSSLDEQDLMACLNGMGALHSTYSKRWEIAKKLAKLQTDKQEKAGENLTKWEGDEMRFVLRLLEDKSAVGGNEELDFYLNRGFKPYFREKGQLGDTFEEKVEKYQGIIVNRVPRRFKKGWWAYRIDSDKDKNSKVCKLLRDEEHWGEVSTNIMVEYNEYIESQFGIQIIRREQEWPRHSEELEWILKSARMAAESLREGKHEKSDLAEFWRKLNGYQSIIDNLLSQLAGVPVYAFRDLVRDEWQPKEIAVDFQMWIWRASKHMFPPFRARIRPENIEDRVHEMEWAQKIVRIEAEKAFHNKEFKMNKLVWEQIVFSGSAALAMVLQNLGEIPFKEVASEFGRLIGTMCAIETQRWFLMDRHREESVVMFLAREKLSKEEYHEKLFKIMPQIRIFFDESHGLGGFYESLAKAQARILDLDQDVEFLISMISQAIRDEKSEQGLLPYIGGIADKVIVDKKLSHEQGIEECRKGFRIAESLEQFEGILSKVVARWEIE